MKKLALLFLIFSSSLQAQSLEGLMSVDGLKLGGWWIDDTLFDGPLSYQYCGKDTICDFPVLRYFGNNASGGISDENDYLPLHVDGEKVFVIGYNCDKNLLYDYSLNPGDSISEGYFQGYKLETISPVQLMDDTFRPQFNLSKNGQIRERWIYGIGNTYSGLIPGNGFYATFTICATVNQSYLWNKASSFGNCEDTWCYDPRPAFDVIKDDSLVTLSNESICPDDYQYIWNFGDGTTSTEVNPEHSFDEYGCYPISLGAFSDCPNDTTYRTTLLNYCTNNAWIKIDEFDFPALRFERVNENIQFAYGWHDLLKSIDNGKTWIELEIPEPLLKNSTRSISDLQFYNELQGIMICRNTYISGQDQTTIFYTSDGGHTWLPAFDSYSPPFYVTLGDNGLAWTILISGGNDFLKSEDYGETWKDVAIEEYSGGTSRYYYVNDSLLYSTSRSIRDSSFLGKSTDQGETWEFELLDLEIVDLHFFDPMNAYLVSDYREVYETSDGGNIWSKVDLPFNVSEFEFNDPNHGWFRTNDGVIYYTDDGFSNFVVTRCKESTIRNIMAINDTLATGIVGGRISLNPTVYKYDHVEFSLSKVGTGNCGEEIISSSQQASFEKSISIYPNPASNNLNIETELEQFGIQVYNISGQEVLQVQNQKSFDIQELPNGTYFMTISGEQGGQIKHGKFIVQH